MPLYRLPVLGDAQGESHDAARQSLANSTTNFDPAHRGLHLKQYDTLSAAIRCRRSIAKALRLAGLPE